MRVLALDAALARCSAALVTDGRIAASRTTEGERGAAVALPQMVEGVLAEACCEAGSLDLIAVTVGPGSFTGLRAAIALAQGIALAAGRKLAGVTTGEALSACLPDIGGRALWVAIDDRRGSIFLERGAEVWHGEEDALPTPDGPVAVAGDAAVAVAARLAARGHDVMLTSARLPASFGVALAATAQIAAGRAPRPAQPLYVAPPATRAPGRPPRPAPHPALS
jgi:tRNA threonylcarbamoyl adenosine modification protein YeaZ